MATQVARVILGLIFLVFGLNGFFHFIPIPPAEGIAGEFAFGLSKAPYFYPFMMSVQVVAGVLLLSGLFVPFAVVLLFPITLHIVLFHLMLAPESLGMTLLIMTTHLLLIIKYWPVYKPVFNIPNAWKARPAI
ncbi:MAG: DoxX family protein [Ferruginibacter sp.]|nr:DoxX family protein [Ferruginibacter sp.]